MRAAAAAVIRLGARRARRGEGRAMRAGAAAIARLPRGFTAGRRGLASGLCAGVLLVVVIGSLAAQVLPSGDAGPAPGPARLSPADATAARALVRQAEGLVTVSPRALGYRVRIAGPRPDVRAQTDTAARTITLFVSPADAPHRVAHDLGHELGHAFDAVRLSAAQRAAYLRTRGAPDATWWPGGAVSDYRSGAGDFAEVFALCHAASPEFRSRLAPRPPNPCGLLPPAARTAMLAGGGS
jgi:hypothetical protein